MMNENLRRELRVPARVPVVVVRGKQQIRVESADVSFRGVFVCTNDPPPLRALVRLRISLPSGPLEAHAMAVHVVAPGQGHEPGVGLQFWGLSGADRTAWDTYVRELMHQRRGRSTPPPSNEVAPVSVQLQRPMTPSEVTPSGIRVVFPEPKKQSSKA